MAGKKYKLTEETIYLGETKLYRIEALKDFYDIRQGDKGGFVEHEDNLSQLGNCWIYDDAVVKDYARVRGNARILCHAIVADRAIVCDCAIVYGHAQVSGDAVIENCAAIFGHAKVYGNARVSEYSKVLGNAQVCGDSKVHGNAGIKGDVIIKSSSDYIVFKNWWSSRRYFTWTRSNNMWSVGCFYGTGKDLVEKAYKDSSLSGREYERVVNYVKSILKDMES